MRQHEAEIVSSELQVVVVTFQSGAMTEAYVRETNLPWPVLIDDRLTLYHSYGMERGRRRDVFGIASITTYIKLMMRGRKLHKLTADPLQLGGDVLIDPEGTIRLHHVGRGPADRPSVESILNIVQAD